MKRKNMCTVLMTALLGGFGLVSCVNNDYDLSQDIDTNVTVGGQLAIPIGSMRDGDHLQLSQLIKPEDSENIEINDGTAYAGEMERGDYYFFTNSYERENKNKFNIDPVTVPLGNSGKKFNSAPIVFNSAIFGWENLPSVTLSGPLFEIFNEKNCLDIENLEMDFKMENTSLSNQISYLSQIEFKNLNVSINVMLSEVSNNNTHNIVMYKGTTMTLPKWLACESNEDFSAKDNVLTLEHDFILSRQPNGLIFKVKDIDCEMKDEDGHSAVIETDGAKHFKREGKVKVNGQVGLDFKEGDVINVSDLNVNFKVVGSIETGKVEIIAATGEFEYSGDDLSTSFDINGLPNLLKEASTCIKIHNPIIDFTIKNNQSSTLPTISMPLIDMISCYDYGNIQDTPVRIENVKFDTNGTTRLSGDRINGVINETGHIPSHVKMNVQSAQINGRVVMGSDYLIDYDFRAPLSFEKPTYIVYTDTIDGWHEDMDGILEAKGLTIKMNVTSTMPMDVTIDDIEFIDQKGNKIAIEVEEFDKVIIKASTDGQPAESQLALNVECTDTKAIQTLDGLRCSIKASVADDSHVVLNEYKHKLTINGVTIQLKEGITMDIDKM